MKVLIILALLLGAMAAVAVEKDFSGNLDKVPVQGTGEYFCGEYFAGTEAPDPDARVAFVILNQIATEGESVAIVVITKKNITVIVDPNKKVPWARVTRVQTNPKVELRISPADLAGARCLQKMPSKGTMV